LPKEDDSDDSDDSDGSKRKRKENIKAARQLSSDDLYKILAEKEKHCK